MAHDHDSHSDTMCPSCDCHPFSRNAYWTGKLMLARDFVDEQQYTVDKLRHHNQHLHGTGVVCGLRVVPHDVEECRKFFVCVEPGTAIDCCGRDIVVCDRDCVDLRSFPDLKKLFDTPDQQKRILQVCIRYRECPTEDIPVLYDECGCDDARCAPNRILESYCIDVEILDKLPEKPVPADNCCDLWNKDTCPSCDQPDCVVLATIVDWVPGAPIVAAVPTPAGSVSIDNLTYRHILPSVETVKEFLDCLKLCEPGGGGGGGGEGPPGKGIDAVSATFVDCTKPGSATIVDGPPRTLVLEVPKGCNGKDGKDGDPGPGLELGLTQIRALSWVHQVPVTTGSLAKIDMGPGQRPQLGIVIAFTNRVVRKSVDAEHVFQVLVEHDEAQDRLPLRCRCAIDGTVIGVENLVMSGPVIVGATMTTASQPDALAFIFQSDNREMPPDRVVELLQDRELWIMLRCDFVIDRNGKAVDGEHVRGTLLSGDRPAPPDPASKFGIQGGLFESWFTLRQG